MLKKYGMYSAANKGNNMLGVSRDHKYSVSEGFLNKIEYFIINHPANCELMLHEKNIKKRSKCSIDILTLCENIVKCEKIKSYINNDELNIVLNYINKKVNIE